MPKSQLFKINPDNAIIMSLVQAFGLSDLEDSRYFTKDNMIETGTVEQMISMKDILKEYYLPCKAKIYLDDINGKRCITILRQFIKPYHYQCLGQEKSIHGTKQMTYRLIINDNHQLSPKCEEKREFVIDFSV
jgi:hypothetical protein